MELGNLSNRQLIKFISRGSRHALVGALEEEFKERAIDQHEVNKIQAEIRLEYMDLEKLQNESLASRTKVIIMSFLIVIPLYVIILEWLLIKGSQKKRLEFWNCISIGIGIYILLLAISVILYSKMN